MKTNRLFITGDSWTKWYRPHHHWVRYLKNHYEVFNYGKAGLNNNEIIHTLHNLPPYKSGDRLVIFFTHCSRVPLSYYGDFESGTIDRPLSRSHFKNKELFKKKSKKEKLEKKYASLLREAFELSKINRSQSDQKYTEADQVLKEIEKL